MLFLYITLAALWFRSEASTVEEQSLPSGHISAEKYSKIIVISDINGDDKAFMRSLWIGLKKVDPSHVTSFEHFTVLFEAALITGSVPAAPLYSGEENILLVQMGNFLAWGPFGKRCIEIFTLVPKIIGWDVRNLSGKFEHMAMMGLMRQRSKHAQDDMKPASTIVKGGRIYQQLLDNSLLWIRIGTSQHHPVGSPHDPSTLFVNGSLSPKWSWEPEVDVDRWNHYMRRTVDRRDATPLVWGHSYYPGSSLLARSLFSQANGEERCAEVDKILEKLKVARMVVGSFPTPSKTVEHRCGGRLILTNTRMSRWFPKSWSDQPDVPVDDVSGGNPAATVMTFDNGSLMSIMAYSTPSVGSDEISSKVIHTAPELSGIGTKRLAESRPQFDSTSFEVSSGGSSQIRPAVMGDSYGFLIESMSDTLRENLQWIETEAKAAASSTQTHIIPTIYILPRRGRIGAFLETPNSKPLCEQVSCGASVVMEMLAVAKFFHARNACIGFEPVPISPGADPRGWIRSFFSIDGSSGCRLSLINFFRLKRDCGSQATDSEMRFLLGTFLRRF